MDADSNRGADAFLRFEQARRVAEAIAHDPSSPRERRLDRMADVIVACGSEKDRLRIRPQGLGGARKQAILLREGKNSA